MFLTKLWKPWTLDGLILAATSHVWVAVGRALFDRARFANTSVEYLVLSQDSDPECKLVFL